VYEFLSLCVVLVVATKDCAAYLPAVSSLNICQTHCTISCLLSCHSYTLHVLRHTLLPRPLECSTSIALHADPIVLTHTLYMSEPSKSASSNYPSNALYTQTIQNVFAALPIFQRYSTHPSNHHPLQPVHFLHSRSQL